MNVNPQSLPTIMAAATECAAHGWHVFPVPPGSKKSHKKAEYSGGREWGATTDPAEIAADWARWPEANLGVVTGPKSGILVVEADTQAGHGVDGVANLKALTAEHGDLPDTIEAESPSGSWHLYFRYPVGMTIGNSASLVAPGVDVRGDGGMVVAPPSVKPGNPRPYRWINPPGFFDLADCPEWLLNLCTRPKLSERAAVPFRIDTGGNAWAEKALAGELAALLSAPTGKRNEALNASAFNLAQIVAGGSLAEDMVKARLQAAAGAIGLEPGEIAATITSGFQAGLQTPRRPMARAQVSIGEQANSSANHGNAAPGDDPVDLWGTFPAPDLPAGLLPIELETFARVQGEMMGADPAGLAVAALVTCAAAINDEIKLQVKRHDAAWTESARIWAALVGSPSTKKSPILSAATAPLCRIDRQMFREWQDEMRKFQAMSKEEKGTGSPPLQTRLRIEDATVEAAQMVLEGSPWGVLLLQDELSGFFGAMDKYSGGKGAAADRAFWLRAFNGGEFALNRVGRGSSLIPNLSVCLLGGIQPEPIRKVVGDAHDDGLLQRLFPVVLKPATMGQDAPAPPVVAVYADLVEKLHKTRRPGFFGGPLAFDDGAQEVRRDLEARHLALQASEAVNRKLASHIGKYDGLFARLCIVWHCIENRDRQLPATVTEDTARRAGDFLHKFLLPHAVAFYGGVLGLSDDHDRLQAIAGYILAHKLERITNRDVQRGDRTMRAIREADIRPLLEQLDALGWLDRIDGPRPSSQPHWIVNPAVHHRFRDRAKQEAARRAEARQAIAGVLRGGGE